MKLSYSQIRLYSECGQKYRYNYIDRLREGVKSGALFFGTAIDKAVEAVLKDPSVNEKEIFDSYWCVQELNGKNVKLKESRDIVYAQSDMDFEILEPSDLTEITEYQAKLFPTSIRTLSYKEVFDKCLSAKKQRAFREFGSNENTFLNVCNWYSLRRKGYLMLQAHRERILPKITKVIDTQVTIKLTNGEDEVAGFADAILHWEGIDEPIVFDYKTSSREYALDSVVTSSQLALYSHALGIKKAGYIVFRKGIKKNRNKVCSKCGANGSEGRHKTCSANCTDGSRCHGEWKESIRPEVDIQIIIDDIPEQLENIVLENADSANRGIKAQVFMRNFAACDGPFGPCAYKGLCFKKSTKGLIKV